MFIEKGEILKERYLGKDVSNRSSNRAMEGTEKRTQNVIFMKVDREHLKADKLYGITK